MRRPEQAKLAIWSGAIRICSVNGEQLLNDRYRLIERVGAGGMASVYQAEDKMLGRLVAVKMLHEGLASDALFVEQFWHEAHAAANLTHPNIVTVHDVGLHDGRPYIIMEFVEGRTLKEIVRTYTEQGAYMPVKRMLDLTIQTCLGIGYAHRSGLVHCDVKPHNVIVTPDERVKVADFGIARAMSQASQQKDVVWGTPQYFAPEQAAGEAPTPASDVYSIGVMMFEMLTGRLPFDGEHPTAIALKHMQANPPSVSLFNPAVPPQLENILLKVLSKEPAGRYRTAGQLGRILLAYRERSDQNTTLLGRVENLETPGLAEEGVTQVHRRPYNETNTAVVFEDAPEEANETDWVAIALGLIALIALLGLIPLWYLVYLAWVG